MTTLSELAPALRASGAVDTLLMRGDELFFPSSRGGETAAFALASFRVDSLLEVAVEPPGWGESYVVAMTHRPSGRRGVWIVGPALTRSAAEHAAVVHLVDMGRIARRRRRRPRYLVALGSMARASRVLRAARVRTVAADARLDVMLVCAPRSLPSGSVREAVGWLRSRLRDAIEIAHLSDRARPHVVVGEPSRTILSTIDELGSSMLLLDRNVGSRWVRAALRSAAIPTILVPHGRA